MKFAKILFYSFLALSLNIFPSQTSTLKVLTSDNKEVDMTPDELKYFKTLEHMAADIEALPAVEQQELAKIKVTEKQINYFKKIIKDTRDAEHQVTRFTTGKKRKVLDIVEKKNKLSFRSLPSYVKAANWLELSGLPLYAVLDQASYLFDQPDYKPEKKLILQLTGMRQDLYKAYLLKNGKSLGTILAQQDAAYPIDRFDIGFSIQEANDFGKLLIYPITERVFPVEYSLSVTQPIPINSIEGINNVPHVEGISAIFLDFNKITKLPQDAFINLKNLKMLFLRWNRINTLEAGCFNGLIKLKDLMLNNNKITSFDPELLSQLTALTDLDVSNNAFPEERKREMILAINRFKPTLRISF